MASVSIVTYKKSTLLTPPISEYLPVPLTFKVENSGVAPIVSCLWEFIYHDTLLGDIVITDQTTTYLADFIISFTAPAAYVIRLTVSNGVDPDFISEQDVTIIEQIQIRSVPSAGLYPLSVNFSVANTEPIDSLRDTLLWDFQNDGLYTSTNFYSTYVYLLPASYTAKLRLRWAFTDKYDSEKKVYTSYLDRTAPISVTYPSLSIGISTNPQTGRIPLDVTISGVANNQVNVWNWSINGVAQVETTQQIHRVFTQKGVYVIQLTATDIYSQGPQTQYATVIATAKLSILDSALEDTDSNRIMGIVGSANITHDGKGLGVKTPLFNVDFQNAGFTHDKGPNVIYS